MTSLRYMMVHEQAAPRVRQSPPEACLQYHSRPSQSALEAC